MVDLLPDRIGDWTRQEPVETYDRQTIFDYIDGAGEVYLMYGFRTVAVGRYARPGAPGITVEVFDMGSAEDAYGVFSHARENEESGIGQAYEHRGSLLSFWQARYFVCVLADEGTQETGEACAALARAIDKRIQPSGGRPELVEYLPEPGLDPYSVRYFHHHSALNYHYFLTTENILHLSDDTKAVLARYNGSTYLLIVEYPSAELQQRGYEGLVAHYAPAAPATGVAQVESGKWVAVKRNRLHLITVFDAASEYDALGLATAAEQRLSAVSR